MLSILLRVHHHGPVAVDSAVQVVTWRHNVERYWHTIRPLVTALQMTIPSTVRPAYMAPHLSMSACPPEACGGDLRIMLISPRSSSAMGPGTNSQTRTVKVCAAARAARGPQPHLLTNLVLPMVTASSQHWDRIGLEFAAELPVLIPSRFTGSTSRPVCRLVSIEI